MATSFTPEEWSRIEPILDDVLELDPVARGLALDRACAGDARLRAQIESLVEADASAEVFLDSPAVDYAAGLAQAVPEDGEPLDDTERDRPGDRVGPYRIIKEIGRGGMGRVFLADRADGQFDQQVALKLVGGGPRGGEILQRFLRERQILARLQHPNIARLLDGGVTADGRPYFAMEYVSGEPITAYCDTRKLDVDSRLDLFIAVCDAVQYAHQSLVVHRDLKPSNTLVTTGGQVKLLDFGIAKVLREEESDFDATLTRFGSGPMTPEYAAPEQVRGEPVTTATDVYALGALAYELLTGRGPHRLARRSAAELERVITERDVERPSTSLARGSSTSVDAPPEAIARARGTELPHLRRQLRGDLDTIVLQALQKEPVRRYQTAGALAEDVRKYRRRLPIAARPDSVRYRTGKFIRRHAIGVVATVLVLASLVAGLIGTTWQAGVASTQAAKATEVSRFLGSLFEVADPGRTNASEITARELLDRGADRIETELADQPEVQTEMMLLLGRIYRQLGVLDRADSLLGRSLSLRRSRSGRDDEQVANTMAELARVWQDAGRPKDAERLQRETLALRRTLLGREHPDVGRTLRDLALVVSSQGEYREAEALQREALTLHERQFGAENADVADDLEGLQSILRASGQLEPATAAARRVLEIRLKVLGSDHLDTATAMNNLALILYDKWDLVEAERLYREVLAFDLRRVGQVHPYTATVTNNLAFVLRDRGQYDEAERLYRSALDLDRRLFGPEHPYTAAVLGNLAVVLMAKGSYDEAERLFRESLAMIRKVYGDNHWRIGSVNAGLAGALSAKENGQAEQLYREAVAQLDRLLPRGHPQQEPALIGLGRLLVSRGAAAEAEPLLQRAFDARSKRLGEGHPRTAEAQVRLGASLAALGRNDQARPLLTAGYERLREEPYFRSEAQEAERLLSTLPKVGGR